MRAKVFRRWVLTLLLLCSALWLGWLIWGLAGKAQIAVFQANKTAAEYTLLEARKTALKKDLEILQTARGQDAAIREAFGVAKSGEEVIVVVPQPVATSTPEQTWWEEWFSWF
jgi:cell division protein FtsB